MDDFYRDYILDHYRHPRNFGNWSSRRRSAKTSIPSAAIKSAWS